MEKYLAALPVERGDLVQSEKEKRRRLPRLRERRRFGFSMLASAETASVQAGNSSIIGIASMTRADNNDQRKPRTANKTTAVTASHIHCTGGIRTTPKLKASEISATDG